MYQNKRNNMNLEKSKLKLLYLLLFIGTTLANAQENDYYREDFGDWYKRDYGLGGDVHLLVRIMRQVEGVNYTEFKLYAEEGGSYYINFWILCGILSSTGTYEKHHVYIEDTFYGMVTVESDGWQAAGLSNNAKVDLKKGVNIISVVALDKGSFSTPWIDFVRLSKDEERAKIPSTTTNNNLHSGTGGTMIYPNPATINSTLNIKSEGAINKIEIYNLSGRLVSTKKLNSNSESFSLSDLKISSSGMYIVNIHSDKSVISQKLIVK